MTETTGNKRFAKVVLTIASPKMQDFYTYSIPDWMTGQVHVGSLVLVPVRKSLRRGVVIDLTDEHPRVKYEIKNIITAYGPERILDEKGIALARWISRYYYSSLFAAVKLLFWDLKNFKIRTEYEIDEPEKLYSFIRGKLGLFGKLKATAKVGSVISERSIRAILKSCEAYGGEVDELLDEILQTGILRPVYRLEVQSGRTVKKAYVVSDTPPVDSEPSPKEEEILLWVSDFGKPVCWDNLKVEYPNSRKQFNSLVKKGLLKEVFWEESPEEFDGSGEDDEIKLTKEQRDAIKQITSSIKENASETFLLEGVTGSGKTEIYVECASKAIKEGSVIVLVPEIVLTLQIVERFKKRFGDNLFVLHSGMGEARLKRNWEKLRGSGNRVVIGPRSALFAPLTDVKLIVIDEEHEPAYKQERCPRYHARDVARKLSSLRKATIVLGSATPSVESRWLADNGVYKHLRLTKRIHKGGLPEVSTYKLECGNPQNPLFLSPFLVNEMRKTLEREKQVLLFINQRGFSKALVCLGCGHSPICPYCNISYTYHLKGNMLLCHHCDKRIPVPSICPSCGGKNLLRLGFGTQRVEEEVSKYFPKARIYRLDRDVASRGGIEGGGLALMKKFFDEHGDILIGTQMIGKGLDLPDVELVGIVSADTSLTLPDFRAAERTFQIVTQVAGRAGRREKKGLVILQSFSLGHYAIEAARMQNFMSFYEKEIDLRRRLKYPPFVSLGRIIFRGGSHQDVHRQAQQSAEVLDDLCHRNVVKLIGILGPSPAPLGRIAGKYRWHLILKARKVSDLINAVNRLENRMLLIKGVVMDIDINPLNMM